MAWSKVRNSAVFRLIVLEVIAVLIFALIIYVTNTIHQRQIDNENQINVGQRVSYNVSLYEDWTIRIVDVIKSIAYTPQVQKYLTEVDQIEKYRMSRDMQRFLSNVSSLRDEIANISFMNNEDLVYSFSAINVTQLEAIREIGLKAQLSREPIFSYISSTDAFRDSSQSIILVSLPVYSIYDEYTIESGSKIGSVILQIDSSVFYDLIGLSAVQRQGVEQYLLNSNNEIKAVITEDKKLIDYFSREQIITENTSFELDGTQYYLASGFLDELDLKLVHIEDKQSVSDNYYRVYVFEIILFIGLFMVLIMVFFLVTNGVIFPLNNLVRHIKELRSQDSADIDIKLHGSIEIQHLEHQFNSLMNEKKDLVDNLLETQKNLYNTELVKKEMEMMILKSQVNPHFLANTLEVMQGVVIREGQHDLAHMIKNLGAVFRYSLRAPEFVEIIQEIQAVEAYLEIQKVRFKNKISWNIRIKPGTEKIKIPKMIIQPIVENSVHHGLSISKNTGKLLIDVYCSDQNLYIKIQDNGVGISADDLRIIQNKLESSCDTAVTRQSEALGIVNVHERIKLIFGTAYGIKIESRQNEGTTAVIKLPVRGAKYV